MPSLRHDIAMKYYVIKLSGTFPRYLEELIVTYQPASYLKSESKSLITVSNKEGVTYGNRCFGKAAATL